MIVKKPLGYLLREDGEMTLHGPANVMLTKEMCQLERRHVSLSATAAQEGNVAEEDRESSPTRGLLPRCFLSLGDH